ncbi:Transcription-associated protein 1 [Chlorella vulgaris]
MQGPKHLSESLKRQLDLDVLVAAETPLLRRLEILSLLKDRFDSLVASHPSQTNLAVIVPTLCEVADLPRQLIPNLMATCHSVLQNDCEENGMISQRILFEVHKTYKQALEEQTAPFFDWLAELYTNLPHEYVNCLEIDTASASVPASRSFKLASEVALMIVFLFQCYPRRLQEHAGSLLPLMVQVASIRGPSLSAIPSGKMSVYNDFRMAQIKSLAFLTVIARSQNLQPLMLPHKDAICSAIVCVMQTVPDVLTTRKELLIALRNILPTPFRGGLLSKMDVLLDEQVLLGSSRTCIEGLRPLAYSTLAELVASCKSELSFEQLAKSTSLRLLYNLIETIFQRRADVRTSELYRGLLSSVLECFVRRLGSLRTQVPRIIEGLGVGDGPQSAHSAEPDLSNAYTLEDQPFPVLLPMLLTGSRDKEVSEFRSLLQTVFSCLKSVLYCMVAFHTNRGLQAPLSFPVKTWSVRSGDVRIVSRLITFGLPALAFYKAVPHPSVDMREQFADLFTVLQDGRDFADVVSPKLSFVFDMASSNPYFERVIQHLVEGDTAARSGVNRYMIALIFRFLVAEKKLDVLQAPQSKEGQLVVQVLEMCFCMLPRVQLLDVQKSQQLAQLGIPPAERVLLPHIVAVTTTLNSGLGWDCVGREVCMRLLRSLFYNMALGKFLDVQAAFGASGLHAKLVDASLDLLRGPAATPVQEELAAELCLLAPARLEHLIPPMPRMMHAVLRALRGSDQSVSVALKVLDLWVDSFNPEFIERSMAGVIHDLMLALWARIQPHPSLHGIKVAEIMGKLGGRSRQWLLDGLSNEYKPIPEYGLRIILAFSPRTSFLVPLDRCVQFAAAAIGLAPSHHQQHNAIRLVHVCLSTLLKASLPKAVAMEKIVVFTALQECLQIAKASMPAEHTSWSPQLGVKTKKQHTAEQQMLVSLLVTTMASSHLPGAEDFAFGTCRHFALLVASGWGQSLQPALPPSSKYASYPVLDGVPAAVAALRHLHPGAISDAFQEGFALDRQVERSAVLRCLAVFLDALEILADAQGGGVAQPATNSMATLSVEEVQPGHDAPFQPSHYASVITDLVARAVHSCYGGHWPSRLGGIAALNSLIARLPSTSLPRLAPVAVKAVFAVLRILPEQSSEEQLLTAVLQTVLSRCEVTGTGTFLGKQDYQAPGNKHTPAMPTSPSHNLSQQTQQTGANSELDSQPMPSLLKQIMEIFVQQLLSSRSSMAVRSVASSGLQAIAKSRGTSTAELLRPIIQAFDSILERRLLPIRSITAQANHAHSVAFIMRTCARELALRSEPVVYVTDACAAMEMSDSAISATASFRGAPVRTDAIVRLRTACLEVLTATIGWQAFSPHEAIINVAKSGVLLALEHNMLPKPILQEALRPILTDLAFYNRINLRLLRHLHHLLDLLSGQFNVTLGDKLSEHLKKWIDVSWAPGTEWEVASGMLDIFHKLPQQAKKFLETQGDRPGIVVLTIGLEDSLPKLPGTVIPSKLCSPYRLPLLRFLNRVAYFINAPSRLANESYFSRLLDMVRQPEGAPLLKALSEAETQLADVFNSTHGSDLDVAAAAQLNCFHLMHAMVKLVPDWCPGKLFAIALQRWRSPEFRARLASPSFLPLTQRLESKWLAKIMLNYIERHHGAFEAVFDMMVVFSSPMAVDFTFLKAFVLHVLAQSFSTDDKRQVLKHWLHIYGQPELDQDHSVNVLRHLINPLVSWLVVHNELDVLTPEIVRGLVMDVFQNPEKGGPSEQIQMELVQLCTTLIQHAHVLFQDHRKELIQFGWWTLKYDNIAKPFAFLCVAHFFHAFPTPEKIMLQVYVALCRLSQSTDPAAKEAVRKGIDIMIPNLARAAASEALPATSLPSPGPAGTSVTMQAAEESSIGKEAAGPMPAGMALGVSAGASSVASSCPSYARYLKRVLSEDGHVSITLVHLLQVIVRNRDLFYPSRVLFMTTMLNVITRLGLPGNSTLENRFLSVDIASTLFRWDYLAAQDATQSAGELPGQPQSESEHAGSSFVAAPQVAVEPEPGSRVDASRLTPGMSEMIVNFLLPRLCKPCTLKLHYFEKFLAQNLQHQAGSLQQSQPSQEPVAALMTGLHIADIFMEHQPDTFVECCAMQLAIMLEPALVSPSPAPVVLLSSVMRRLVRVMMTLSDVAQPLHVDAFAPGCNSLVIMQETMKANPDCMKPLIGPLLRAMHRLAKEHNQAPALGLLSAKADQPAGLHPSKATHGSGSWFMCNSLNVAVPSALTLSADHRKHFLSTLVMLITGQSVRAGTTDPSILHLILTMLRKWLLDPTSAHLTAKELLVIIQRIAQLDRMHAIPPGLKPLWDKDFLALLYDTITLKTEDEFGSEVFNRVERTFCCGLQSADPEVRQKFFRLYADRVPSHLFDRLRYVIQGQDWDFIAHTFWLKHGVAMLFDSLYLAEGITLAYNSAHLPSLFGISNDTGTTVGLLPDVELEPKDLPVHMQPSQWSGKRQTALQDTTGQGAASAARMEAAVIPLPLSKLLIESVDFMMQQSMIGSDALVSCLIELVQYGAAVAHHLWVLLFPIVWSSLQKEQQTALAKPIIQLLAKEHHTRQAVALRPTVGQTLLEGISQSQPQPKIPAEMIKYMGRRVHAWHIAVSMLEGHVVLFPADMRCFDALCHLYRSLAEDDMAFGLWHRRAVADDTRVPLAQRQHGFLALAQLQFLELMGKGVSGGVPGVTKNEMVLWHHQYLACCFELNQWDTVVEYAKVTDNCPLQIDAMVHLHDWQNLKAMVLPKAQIEENADATIVRAQLHLQELQVVDVDRICKQAMHQCVQQWWNMPEGNPWSYAPALHTFQRIVELQESWRIMVEFNTSGGPGQQYQEHKVYNLTIRQFGALQSIAPNMHQMGYRDKAWSVNRLGRIARLHYQPEACVQIINTLYGFNAMEVQEAFVKVREQAKAFLQKSEDHMQGLNLINSTNLDYFQPQHQAEMINLKAQFFAALGDSDAAHGMFSEALTLWPLCWEAWMAWGKFCDGILASTDARDLVPRLLQLLMVEPRGAETLGRAIAQKAVDLPGWIWLPWIPQLMTSLQRPEVAVSRRILSAAASSFPQQMYWHVRPSMLAMKDAAVKAVQDAKAQASARCTSTEAGMQKTDAVASVLTAQGESQPVIPSFGKVVPSTTERQDAKRPPSPQIEKPIEVMAYEACRDVMEALRAKYSGPLQVLDHFMTEVGQRFTTRTEERLLAVVYTLQQRTYKTGLPSIAAVPEGFKKELAGVCKACGSRDTTGPGRLAHFQQQFAKDLDPASSSAPHTLGDMTDRLKGWRMLLESMIDHEYAQTLKMEVEAPMASSVMGLIEMSLEEMEMPGQHLPAPDAPDMVYVDRLGSSIQVVRRNSNSFRRIVLHGSDGSLRTFLIQSSQTTTGSEERIQALLRNANARLLAHAEARRRLLQLKAPIVLVPYQGVRMVEDDTSIVPFGEAYETHCARYGREADAPILAFKSRCCTADGITANSQTRLAAYQEVLEKGVTENIFSQYMYKTMVENNLSMWIIKKQFALSAAIKLLISRSMGTITHADLITTYDTRFQLERGHETVPFRLTRNMQSFIGPQGMEGMVVCAMTSAAQALQTDPHVASAIIALFFRDDILSWAARRSGARCIAALNASLKTTQLETCVAWNTAASMHRITTMAPAREGHPQQGTRALVAEAVAAENLARMCPTWSAWL